MEKDRTVPDVAGRDGSPYERDRIACEQRMAHHLIQSIIQEMPDQTGTTGLADSVWWRLEEIDNQNGLHPLEFNDVFNLFVQNYNGGVD